MDSNEIESCDKQLYRAIVAQLGNIGINSPRKSEGRKTPAVTAPSETNRNTEQSNISISISTELNIRVSHAIVAVIGFIMGVKGYTLLI